MKVTEIMTQPVITVKSDTTLEEVAKMMLDNNIGGLPVVDEDGGLIGIVTESDFSAKEHAIPFSRIYAPQLFGKWMSTEGIEKAYEAARTIKVSGIMSTPVISVNEDDNMADAVKKMLEYRVHRVPVLRGGKPIGVLTRHDLLKMVVKDY